MLRCEEKFGDLRGTARIAGDRGDQRRVEPLPRHAGLIAGALDDGTSYLRREQDVSGDAASGSRQDFDPPWSAWLPK